MPDLAGRGLTHKRRPAQRVRESAVMISSTMPSAKYNTPAQDRRSYWRTRAPRSTVCQGETPPVQPIGVGGEGANPIDPQQILLADRLLVPEGTDVRRLPIPGLGDPRARFVEPAPVMNALSSSHILSDERIQASRSFSSNGLLR